MCGRLAGHSVNRPISSGQMTTVSIIYNTVVTYTQLGLAFDYWLYICTNYCSPTTQIISADN